MYASAMLISPSSHGKIFSKSQAKTKKQRIMGELEHSIDNYEFDQAYVYLELGLEDVTRWQTVLTQTYPNPFNPEA